MKKSLTFSFAMLLGVVAVSYTHLDVYKRQVHSPFDFLKVPDSAFQFCLARPIVALLVAEVEVVHQQIRKRGPVCLLYTSL